MIGALIYLQKARISPDAAFSVLDWSAYVIFIVIIGGVGSLHGAVLGSIFVVMVDPFLTLLKDDLPGAIGRFAAGLGASPGGADRAGQGAERTGGVGLVFS